MQITEIQIYLMNEERLKAFASVTFDNCFVVRNMKVVATDSGVKLCMPSRKTANNEYRDLAHPITQAFRSYLESSVLEAYHAQLAGAPQQAQVDTRRRPTV